MADTDVSIQPSPAQLLRWFYQWSHPLRPRRKTRAERLAIYRVRRVVFERSDGLCEMGISPKCLRVISWRTMHTAHIVSRARGGSWEPSQPKGCLLRVSYRMGTHGRQALPSETEVPMKRKAGQFAFALSVRCPRCNAGPSHWCRELGKCVAPHRERSQEAIRLLYAPLMPARNRDMLAQTVRDIWLGGTRCEHLS